MDCDIDFRPDPPPDGGTVCCRSPDGFFSDQFIFGSEVKGLGKQLATQAGSFPRARRSTKRSHFRILSSVPNWWYPDGTGQ